jgi:hypothetical protein
LLSIIVTTQPNAKFANDQKIARHQKIKAVFHQGEAWWL